MSTNLDCITRIPREIRQVIFSNLSPKDLFGLSKVCKLFNGDLTNEFFQKKCYEIFQSLKLFPNFYDPILKTVKTPWKLICFALSTRTQLDFLLVARRTAHEFQSNFNSYLSDCAALKESDLRNDEIEMRSICGDYYQDHNSKIDQAWKFSQENWSEQDKEELNNLEQLLSQRDLHPELQYWTDMAADLFRQNIYSKNDSSFSINYSVIYNTLKARKADPRVIRYYELCNKFTEAPQKYEQLETKRKKLNEQIEQKKRIVNLYDEIIHNPILSQTYSREIIYQIFYFLSHLKKWGDHVPELVEIIHAIYATPVQFDNIKKQINSLSQEYSSHIWKTLYDTCANNAQEWQWSENHFHEHIRELGEIVFQILGAVLAPSGSSFNTKDLNFKYEDCNKNPCLRSEFLQDFSKSYAIN